MLRILIGDVSGVTYTDDSLKKLILVSAIAIQKEVHFDTTYIINFNAVTITPDPTDDSFTLLCSHKAAILLISSEIRSKTNHALKITDGPSSIDLTNIVQELRHLYSLLVDQFEQMKKDYTIAGNFGYAVITPTTVEYISPNTF